MAYEYESAEDVVNGQMTDDSVDVDAKARADAAGVEHVAYVGYAAALKNYENRTDVEELSDRRLRDVAPEFADQDKFRARNTVPGKGYTQA